jgi:hypothetical protein
MSTRKHTFFQQILNSSLTKKIAYHTAIPLMAFPKNKKEEKQHKLKEKTPEATY